MLKRLLLCLLLTVSLLLGPAALAGEYSAQAHPEVDPSSMLTVTGSDETALQPALGEELDSHMDGEPVPQSGRRHPIALIIMNRVALAFILFCIVSMVRCTRFLNKHNGWEYFSGSRRRQEEEAPEEPWSSSQERPPWEF